MRFQNKVMAITGAAQGIGRQTAEQAAREGARLLLIDRSRYVHELAATLAKAGCDVLALEADLEQWESTGQAFATGVAHFGRLDILINNVGGTIWAKPLLSTNRNKLKKKCVDLCFPRFGGAVRHYHGCYNRVKEAL